MFLSRTDVTCLTLPLYSTPVNSETSPQKFAKNRYNFPALSRSLAVLFTLVCFSSCTEISEPDSYNQVYDVFGNMEHEDEFWQQIDTTHLLIENKQYAQAKARLLEVRESTKNDAHQAIIRTISLKINVLQREKGAALRVRNWESDLYLQSTSTVDLMLAYNFATGYIKGLASKLESIKFPGALDKSKHVVFHKGMYRIRSYAFIRTTYGKTIRSRFNCDIKLHKDRKSFVIQSLEIRK